MEALVVFFPDGRVTYQRAKSLFPEARGAVEHYGCSLAKGVMRYHALACDYDGTIAHHGTVDEATLTSLANLKETGRRLVLVTGRELPKLREAFPGLDLFDEVVAENGALLYTPSTHSEKALADAPPPELVEALQARGVTPLSVGAAIVATWVPQDKTVLDIIQQLGLELQLTFNKGAVMVLPPGVNKATGLTAALAELKLSAHNSVGVGDAENDHAFLGLCECSVAVANALPALKNRVDLVTKGEHGRGVAELVDMLIRNDLRDADARLARHDILLGKDDGGNPVQLRAHGGNVLIAGTSGAGKSTLTTGILERLAEKNYQVCIVDPEGDYEHFEQAVVLGTSDNSPTADEALEVLDDPRRNASINLLAIRVHERTEFVSQLFPKLLQLRSATGRPHWVVVDETHHLFPKDWSLATNIVSRTSCNHLLITVHPDQVAPPLLNTVDTIIVIGNEPDGTIRSFCDCIGRTNPSPIGRSLEPGEAVLWRVDAPEPVLFRSIPPQTQLRRHLRKYAEGRLGEDKSFYFRGPDNRLHLRAHNLVSFVEIGNGLDDDTWLYHLRKGDYSRWIASSIKDEELAKEVAAIESTPQISAEESRTRLSGAVDRRYTLPA